MFYKAHQSFLNYLSIVEICIDKSLSEQDLCSCQLSQREFPLGHRPDRSARTGQLGGFFLSFFLHKDVDEQTADLLGDRWGPLAFDLREMGDGGSSWTWITL